MNEMGRIFIVLGITFLILGIAFSGKLGSFGKLPGDILIEKESITIYIPITSMLLLSGLLTLFFWLFNAITK